MTDVNRALTTMLGYTREELIGQSYRQFHTPASLAAEEERLHRIRTKGKVVQITEIELVRRDGTLIPLEAHTRFIRDHRGNPLGVLGIFRDLTERKRAEEALRRSEKFNASLIDQSPLGIIVYAPDGHAVSVNRAWEHMWGVAWEQMKEYNLFTDPQLVGTPMHEALERLVKQGGETPSFELEYDTKALTPDGNKHWTFCRFYTVQEENGEVRQLVCLNEDISTRKQMEAELRRAKDAAEAASRAKSEFLANMSHEIRTPMNGIIGMTDLALDTNLTREQREYLGMVKTSAASLLTILNDILDFSKIEAGKLTLAPIAFPLRDSIGEAVRTLAVRAHQKGLELNWRVAPDAPDLAVGDVGRLRQILINLVGNAIKFTERGEVVVEVQSTKYKVSGPTLPSQIGSQESETCNSCLLHFTIRDTGIGIAPEKQQLIFDPFAQADGSMTRKYGGTGLGLAISSQLVTLMGGELKVESVMGRGSAFHFTVQLGVQQTGAAATALAIPASFAGAPVLIVDDNATSRACLTELLRSWRMQPTEAESGHVALAALRQAVINQGPPPLLLLDAHMPDMDGFTLARQIKQHPTLKKTTIIMLTSSGQPGDIARCQALGIPLHLGKPIKHGELRDVFLTALNASLSPSSSTALASRHNFPAWQSGSPCEDEGRLSILLVEDNPVNQKLAVRVLEKWGHQVKVASNGKEALAILEQQQFDLALMDVQMPEMDGLEATALIRARERFTTNHLPIIAMTAHAMQGDRERCLAAGMDDYLTKPLQLKELRDVIQHAAARTHPDATVFENLSNLQSPHSDHEAEYEKVL
jgi:PAS domain S-box-containing protein